MGNVRVTKDGRSWRLGIQEDVAWIAEGTSSSGVTVTVAIPPVFEAYATFHEPDDPRITIPMHERAVVRDLVESTPAQPWWLGFLETGAHDVVFDTAPRVSLYWDWPYVMVEAGPEQALGWRTGHMRSGDGALPDLFFPADRSWLVSGLWDDTWNCFGGTSSLIAALRLDPLVRARPIGVDEDACPPDRERE